MATEGAGAEQEKILDDAPAASSSEPKANGGRAPTPELSNKEGAAKEKQPPPKPRIDTPKKGPPGGYDATPLPRAPPGYTVKVTFHRATNLPFADLNTMSADPFILAQLNTSLPRRHKQDDHIRFRTQTIQKSVDPVWNSDWILANVPASGFEMKARIYDEDPADHDDRLGNAHVKVGRISEGWEGITEQPFGIKKRMGSKRAYFLRGCASLFNRDIDMSGELFVSVKVLGRTQDENGGRIYTIGPCNWIKHYSPLFGRLVGTKDPEDAQEGHEGKEGQKNIKKYNFQANQIQLRGPVPEELYHRYVEFRPFISGMFTGKSLRGYILNRALHHQHSRIYNYDRNTEYGSFPSPSLEMTKKFLDLVFYDKGGRIFTYVISLDGQWRFTQTGKEFGIDLLSKHSMHSDVSIYIAFSGEFFVRRLKTPWKDPSEQKTHPPDEISGGPPNDDPPKDPAYYNLIIDNDSGTYRPNKDLLPLFKHYMESNLPGLKITTLDCQGDAKKMEKMKKEQRERQKKEGGQIKYTQADDSSISSSDEEDLQDEPLRRGKLGNVVHKVGEPKGAILEWAQKDGKKANPPPALVIDASDDDDNPATEETAESSQRVKAHDTADESTSRPAESTKPVVEASSSSHPDGTKE